MWLLNHYTRDTSYGFSLESYGWMMLQQEQSRDFVIATGVQYSVRQFIEKSVAQLGITIRWEGEGREEIGIIESLSTPYASLSEGSVIVRVDARYFRPAEVETLLGDPAKSKADLGWVPEITLDEMVEEMVAHDLDLARRHALLKANGYTVEVSRES
jgi:GDPmannose 4,6-dehydratase